MTELAHPSQIIRTKDIPCPSMTKKKTVPAARKRQLAKMYPYRKSISPTINGVKKASKKFQNQFDAVASAIALERYLDG